MTKKKQRERAEPGDYVNVEGCHANFRPVLIRYEQGNAIVSTIVIAEHVFPAAKVFKAPPLAKPSKRSASTEEYD